MIAPMITETGITYIQKRCYESSGTELIKVTWKLTWKPKDKKWPTFQKHILEFEACKDEPDHSVPSADKTMSNLEPHGFATEVKDNTWKHKLHDEVRKKFNFD